MNETSQELQQPTTSDVELFVIKKKQPSFLQMMDEYPKRSNQRMSLIGYKIRQRALSKKSIKD